MTVRMPVAGSILALGVLMAGGATALAGEAGAPYVRLGAGIALGEDAHFSDADCAAKDPAAYFGCGDGADGRPFGAYGDFGQSPVVEGAVGYVFADWLRAEVVVSYRPALDFSGDANFDGVPLDRQPVHADVSNLSAVVEGAVSPAPLFGLDDLPVQPFISAGLGVARNETDRMAYRFPSLGSNSATITPSGTRTDFAWSLGAGIDIPLGETLVATLAYRHADLGEVETDRGPIRVIRPAGELLIPVGETSAPLTVDEVLFSVRAGF